MYITVILPMIWNLQTHAEQSRARASLHDDCQCFYRVRHSKDTEAVFR